MQLFKKAIAYYKEVYTMGHYPTLYQLLNTEKIYPYYGFLGDGNFGDELVFEATKKLFSPNILIPIKKRMPILIRLFCLTYKSRFSGIVIGGGTLIGPFWEKDFFMNLKKEGKPVYVHGTGVHEIVECDKEWKEILSNPIYGGIRGPLSKKYLCTIHQRLEITGDAAFSLYGKSLGPTNHKEKKTIIINLGTHAFYKYQENVRGEFQKLLNFFFERNYEVIFLPFHQNDVVIGSKLKINYPELILLDSPKNYNDAVKIFNSGSFAIGERLHFIVMAALSQCPFLSINYSTKHKDLLSSIKSLNAGVNPRNFSLQIAISAFESRSKFKWDKIESNIKNLKELQFAQFHQYISSATNLQQ